MALSRTAGVVAGVLSAGAVATGVVVVTLPRPDTEPAATTAPASTGTIVKQTLVDRESHSGLLGHGDTVSVTVRNAGTVTALPAESTTVTRGKALFRLDNKPVTLLYGKLPAYRALATGVTGADVRLFEQNLWALGYRGFTVDATYSASTAVAVRRWQAELGLVRTGTVDQGQIVYAAGAVRIDSLSSQTGAVVGPGTEIEKVTGTAPLAMVTLDMTSARLAKRGTAVQVTLPDSTIVPGRINKVSTVVSAGEKGEGYTTTVQVTIQFTGTAPGSGSVTVGFTAGERKNALTVPVRALLALAEGGYGLQVDSLGTVPVETGLFADGQVEISGSGLRAGMKVVVPS